MTDKLKPCPCGQTPANLYIADGTSHRWRQVSGDCCGIWEVEARVTYGNPEEVMRRECEQSWNDAPRFTIDPATREALEAAVDALNAEAAQQKVRADWFKPGSSGYQSRMDVAQEYTAHAAAIEKLLGGE